VFGSEKGPKGKIFGRGSAECRWLLDMIGQRLLSSSVQADVDVDDAIATSLVGQGQWVRDNGSKEVYARSVCALIAWKEGFI